MTSMTPRGPDGTPDASPPAAIPALRPEMDATPPLLGSWRNIYLVVLGNLAVLVLLFWLLARAYR